MAGASNGVGMVEDGPRPESFSVIFINVVMSRQRDSAIINKYFQIHNYAHLKTSSAKQHLCTLGANI